MKFRTTFLFCSLMACASVADLNPISEKQGNCELRPAKDQCTDWVKFKGVSMVTMQGVCTSLKASLPTDKGTAAGWSEGSACNHAGALGGCQSSSADGSVMTNWFYQGATYKTAEDAQKECGSGQTFVNP